MTVVTRPQRSRTGTRLERRVTRRSTGGETQSTAQSQTASPQARERAAGGPQDLAAYTCSCGCVFEAPVSTTVGCPHCGGTQAW